MLVFTKNLIRLALIVLMKIIHVDIIFCLAARCCCWLSRMLYFRDWVLMSAGRPQFFNHQLNLYQWNFEPKRWSFTARGLYPREVMFQGCKVLDVCCGNGSYSYLFFSDIAGCVDAIDKDSNALAFARNHFAAENINYLQIDVLKEDFPASDYDVIVLNAAISYFNDYQINIILKKIVDSGKDSMLFFGMTPVTNNYIDHKTEFSNSSELEQVLNRYFVQVEIKVIEECAGKSMYFRACKPTIKMPVSEL